MDSSIFNKNCQFEIGAANISQIPATQLPEFAFVGRSNVGKSSLINALVGQKALARVSQNPGCTRQINFFNLADVIYMVDLPGYGFARISKLMRSNWDLLIHKYLRTRKLLKRVFLLIDARHPFKEVDIKTMAYLDEYAISYQIVFTKSDKLTDTQIQDLRDLFLLNVEKNPACHPEYIVTSSLNKDGLGKLKSEILLLYK